MLFIKVNFVNLLLSAFNTLFEIVMVCGPFFPRQKTIKYEELSDYQQKLISKSKYNPSKKLIADLENKVNIIVDYRTFKKKLPGICIKILNSILLHFTLIKLMNMGLSPYILMG